VLRQYPRDDARRCEVVHDTSLRPVELRVLRMTEQGLDDAEIGRRFCRSEEWAARVRTLCAIPRPSGHQMRGDVLRPLERRVLRWRASGATPEEFSARFRRSPDFLRRVEALAQYRLRPPDQDLP
jgi:DNA-binding CsgD family transcriptional regulator